MSPLPSNSLTRRAFLATGAALGWAAVQRPAQAHPPLRLALAGCGAGGREIVAALAGLTESFHLVAVCDRDAGAAQALVPDGEPVSAMDWSAVLEYREIDAIALATPDFLHAEMASAALERGKHVFLLPPVSATAADAQALLANARCANRVLYVSAPHDQVHRWNSAKHIVANQIDGLRWVQAGCPAPPRETPAHWARRSNATLGPAARQIFESLYPLQYHLGLGNPERLTAMGGILDTSARETLDTLTITARYAGGVTVVLPCGPGRIGRQAPILRGSRTAVELEPISGDQPAAGLTDELRTFAEAVRRGSDQAMARLEAACSVQVALCNAVEGLRRDTVA